MRRVANPRAMHPRARRRDAGGAALLLVLWLVTLLIALVGAFALNARMEYLQGRVAADGVQADAAARAGLEYAITRVNDADPARQWIPDGRANAWDFGGIAIQVSVLDESGKVDLNEADATLLAGLFRVVGVGQREAAVLASAIIDWRDADSLGQPEGGAEDPQYAEAGRGYGAKDAPFDTIAELEQVLGMSPEVYAKVAPHLTVYTGSAQPDQQFASALVLQAMGLDPGPILGGRQQAGAGGVGGLGSLVAGGSGTYSIESRARLRNGRESMLRAVVRAGASGVPGSAYTPLRWEEGASAL